MTKKPVNMLKLYLGDPDEKPCVFCGYLCEPSPTEHPWIWLENGNGIHYDCLEHLWDNYQAMRKSKPQQAAMFAEEA